VVSPEIITLNLKMVATMAREIANKPHPTPNPDGPHAAGSIRGTSGGSGETLQPKDDFAVDEPNYDSCVDDLNLILSQPVTEPDPALRSKGSSDVVVQATGSSSTDDHFADARLYWALIGLMCYSSAVTLALTWVLWTGREFRPAEAPVATTEQPAGESLPRMVDFRPVAKLAQLPAGNLAKLGETVRIGDLEVTPVEVVVTQLELARSIEPRDWRREDAESVVLRLRLTNVSQDQSFAPLERAFVREQSSPLDRSSIATNGGKIIGLFPLAIDSEWSIAGQGFPVLKPGESTETVIASELGALNRLTSDMTWRVRLRIGPYKTDMIGVRFDKDDLNR
jgi:hypothetical protein